MADPSIKFRISPCIGSGLIVLGLVNTVKLIEPRDLYNSTAFLQSNVSENGEHFIQKDTNRNILTTTTNDLILGLAICVVHGISDVIYFYCSKTLKNKVEDILVLDFWYLWGSITFTSLFMVFFEKDRLSFPTKLDDIIYLATHSLTSGIAHMLNYVLLTLISFIAIGILVNLEIPLAMLCQYVIVPHFQPIKGGVFDLSGAVVITVGLLLPSLAELWYFKHQQTQPNEQEEKLDETGIEDKERKETEQESKMETFQSQSDCLSIDDDSHTKDMTIGTQVKNSSF